MVMVVILASIVRASDGAGNEHRARWEMMTICEHGEGDGRRAPSRVVMSSASTTCEDPRARAPLRAAGEQASMKVASTTSSLREQASTEAGEHGSWRARKPTMHEAGELAASTAPSLASNGQRAWRRSSPNAMHDDLPASCKRPCMVILASTELAAGTGHGNDPPSIAASTEQEGMIFASSGQRARASLSGELHASR
ncbi:hypothetical protein Dimus_038956 [Dionaea muscipula]